MLHDMSSNKNNFLPLPSFYSSTDCNQKHGNVLRHDAAYIVCSLFNISEAFPSGVRQGAGAVAPFPFSLSLSGICMPLPT